MVLELHIWGPAFGLPSIDPECLAAVAYFTQAVPLGRWVLVAGQDEGASEIRELPALRDGSTTVTGFPNIVEHLRIISSGQWDLDAHLAPMQKADCLAFSTLLTTHAAPLLDLSLYISSQNYTTTTRPAYTCLLSFPATWIIPPKRRSAAKGRSAHLGLSSLDLDSTSPDPQTAASAPAAAAATEALPASLRNSKPNDKKSVSAAIRNPETASRIRLEALTQRVLEPLSALLWSTSETVNQQEEKGPFLLSSERPSTLDCLALGYLALFLVPDVPLPFLSRTLKERYPNLADYVRRDVKRCFGGEVKAEDAMAGRKVKGKGAMQEQGEEDSDSEAELHHYTNMHIGSGDVPVVLPWRRGEAASPLSNIGLVLKETVREVPVLGGMMKPDPVIGNETTTNGGLGTLPLGVGVGLGLGVAAIVGAVVWGGAFGLGGGGGGGKSTEGSRERLRDLGETGDLLGLGRRKYNASLPVVEGALEGGLGVGVVVDR
ncbi:hypothetical protein MMC30_008372 [Trapelia coarctata]|nr:hypothetical protein [Trapelia coarctata]